MLSKYVSMPVVSFTHGYIYLLRIRLDEFSIVTIIWNVLLNNGVIESVCVSCMCQLLVLVSVPHLLERKHCYDQCLIRHGIAFESTQAFAKRYIRIQLSFHQTDISIRK